MSTGSSIEWTEATWNPITGCTKVSQGCKHCYAERMAKRLQAMGAQNYRNGFSLTLHPHMLELPKAWKRPRKIFVNSMSDIFHPDVPTEFILEMWDVMLAAPQHQYQLLTKRPERLAEIESLVAWAPQIWMGVTVESARHLDRIDLLRGSGAFVKFLSLEPLLGPLQSMDLTMIDWAIVGGESGPKARPLEYEWVIDIRDQCLAQQVSFFFKQWGGVRKKSAGRLLDGRTWDEMPRLQTQLVLV
ncbi:MAG: phage Gp37/Gp68 family protein [Thermomicrobiales bacterium]